MRASLLVLAAFGVASATASLVYPDSVPLHRRQAPGTPEYDCHANCGGVIVAARTEGYCETANFTTSLDLCLDCALQYDIWQYYGNSVSEAATACGLDATPLPANTTSVTDSSSVAGSTSAPATVATSASVEATTTASTIVSSTIVSSTIVSSTDTATSAAGETSASETSSAAPSAETFDGAGNKVILSGGLAMVPLGALVAGFI